MKLHDMIVNASCRFPSKNFVKQSIIPTFDQYFAVYFVSLALLLKIANDEIFLSSLAKVMNMAN